ncbi:MULTISPECIES: DUF7507 domain-containing protein [unclassified Leucobacter]|uniref:DUF7507 domain-containing protein n=1 Tax=unclassified Leucobacter TaxID=2621730 RepID=UPI0006227542|nr:CARDB domain-containing protein [Leucobacter sp. Ag1]KKI22349.1 hypothetical protein XM48_02110 [Leucobacter sp. Ag1]
MATGLTVATEAVAPPPASAAQDPTSCQGTVALTNGGFESPAIPNATYRMLAESAVPGWGTNDSQKQIEIWSSGFQGVPAGAGRQFAELNANSASMLFQDVATTPGQTLAWSLKHRGRSGTDVMRVVIGAPNGTLVQNGPNLSDGTSAWGSHTGTYTVPAGQTTTRFGFEAVSSAGGNASVGNFLDDITFGTGPCLITTKSVTNLSRGGTTAEVGDVLRYTVTTRNDGGNPALQSVSSDRLDAGLDFVPGSIKIASGPGAGSLTDAAGDDRGEYGSGDRTVKVRLGDGGNAAAGGSIGVGSSTSYTFDAKVKVSAAGGNVTNEANVAFRDAVVNQDRTSTSQQTVTPVNPAADLTITKVLDAGTLVSGRTASFTITAKNNGPQTATGVKVTDPVPDGLTNASATTSAGSCAITAGVITCSLPDLAVGQTETIRVTGTVVPSRDPGAALSNTATISGSRTDPDLGNNTASASRTLATEADVSVQKTFAPADPVAGQNVTYTLTTHNAGPSEARDVVLTDPLDPQTVFVGSTPGKGTCENPSGTLLTCRMGTLAVGETVVTTVTVRIAAGATAVVQNSVSVTSSTSDPDPSNNADSTSFQPDVIADLALTKTASTAQVSAGGAVDFTLAAENLGTSDAVNAVLSDTVPAGFTVTGVDPSGGANCGFTPTTVTCTWGTFAAGGTANIVVHTAVAADAPAGTVTNTASIVSPAKDANPANNSDSADVEIVQSADLGVTKTAPSTGVPGSEFTYTLTVQNHGPSVARGATVSDTLPADFGSPRADLAGCGIAAGTLSCALGDLAPGASVTVHVTGTWSTTATGTVRNTAETTSATPDPNADNNTSTADVDLRPSADVAVTKTVSDAQAPLGGTVEFTITVANRGPSAAQAVVVDDAIPAGLVITKATPSTGSWSDADARWTVGTLLPGKSATLQVTARTAMEGEATNTAVATSQTPDPDPTNNTDSATVTVTPSADLSIVKTVSHDPAPLNGQVTYTIVVKNAGPSAAADVRVSDPLPAALLSPRTSTPGCTITGSTLDCAAGTLAVGATLTVTVTGTVDPATKDSRLSNTATVSSTTPDPVESNNRSTIAVPVAGAPRVELVKTAAAPRDANGSGRIDAGDTVAYTFTIRNTGDVSLTGAAITDPMLGGAVACPQLPASLAPGGEVACAPVAYTLTQQDLDRGTVHNEASVVAQSARGTADDDAEANVTIPAVDAVSLRKVAGKVTDTNGSGHVDAGDRISYVFTVTNTGTTTLKQAKITDPMLGGAVACPALDGVELAPGQSVACAPVAYTLTQQDIDGGVVKNTAKVVAKSPTGTVDDTAAASADIERTAGIDLHKQVGLIRDTNTDGRVSAGDTVDYSFRVDNIGNTTLQNVKIADPLLGEAAICTFAELPAGASANCGPFAYTLTQQDLENESRPNTATATGTSPIGQVGDSASAEVRFESVTSIALTKTPGPVDRGADDRVGAGDTVGYTFTIRNTGTTILRDIVLDDPKLGGTVVCDALDGLELAPQEEAVCGPVDYRLTQADVDSGSVHNTATVTGESRRARADASAEATVKLQGVDGISLLKSAAKTVDANRNGRTDAGDTIAYTFTVTNTGTTTLKGVIVKDPRLSGPIDCPTTTLAPGEAMVCDGPPAVITQAEIDAGKIRNTATVTGNGSRTDPPTATDTVVTPLGAQPAIALTKRGGDYADTNGNAKVDAGDTVQFRFTVTNTGTTTLTKVAITDPKLGGTLDCGLGELAPGATAECGPIAYRLTVADVAAGKVVNVATASGTAGTATVTAAATATVELAGLATTGGPLLWAGWIVALLAVAAGVLLLFVRQRRKPEAALDGTE